MHVVQLIDLHSDTATRPTAAMRSAMPDAEASIIRGIVERGVRA
jgi:hypothetical protein